MEYRFRNTINPLDFWILYMRRTYQTLMGLCNIIFTIAMFALTYRFFFEAHDVIKILMILGCVLFPILQPVVVFKRAMSQAAMLPKDLEMSFNESGMLVSLNGQKEQIPWKKITSVKRQYNMMIIYSDEKHGYLISDRMLGEKKAEFWDFAESNISKVKN